MTPGPQDLLDLEKQRQRQRQKKLKLSLSLQEWVKVPDAQRTPQWEEGFFERLVQTKVRLLSKSPQRWADSWPYIMVSTETEGKENISSADALAGTHVEISTLLYWLKGRGIGLCVNPQKNPPDYLFNYGMLWHYQYRGTFLNREGDQAVQTEKSMQGGKMNQAEQVTEQAVQNGQKEVAFTSGEKIYVASPFPHYFPEEPQKVIRSFLQDQGVSQPKVLLMSRDKVSYDLAFSLDSLGFPPAEEHRGIAEALAWFFPLHYSLLLIEEKGLPPFFPL